MILDPLKLVRIVSLPDTIVDLLSKLLSLDMGITDILIVSMVTRGVYLDLYHKQIDK